MQHHNREYYLSDLWFSLFSVRQDLSKKNPACAGFLVLGDRGVRSGAAAAGQRHTHEAKAQ